MPRTRTTKKLAQRIDLNYFKRSSPLRRWRTWLVVGLPALAVVWLVWLAARRDNTVYSSGQLSSAHAVLNADCAACHVREAGRFKAAAKDTACLACHDGPVHKENQMFTPTCASCHADHRGPIRLAETSDASCTQCHANLLSRTGIPKFEAQVAEFSTGHPDFAVLRQKLSDPGTIKLNHTVHLKKDLRGPDGKPLQLFCQDCHRLENDHTPWKYGGMASRASDAGMGKGVFGGSSPAALLNLRDGRLMSPVKFENACNGCHLLQFDKRFSEEVPHGKQLWEILAFLSQWFGEYIVKHPSELRVVREPSRNLAGKPIPPSARNLSPEDWVMERVLESTGLLSRKTCKQCHHDASDDTRLKAGHVLSWLQIKGWSDLRIPEVLKANTPLRWMPHAKFSHAAHQMLTCASCHAATTSTETSDVLMPGIATCRTCHNQRANGAESRCFLCHTYHDWSREKPVRGKFRLREITGDRPPEPGEQKVSIE